jgi:hypothetical protein
MLLGSALTLFILVNFDLYVSNGKWVSCLYGTASPQVTDGGHGLQIWIAENILNIQSQTADKGWSSSLGITRGGNNSSI